MCQKVVPEKREEKIKLLMQCGGFSREKAEEITDNFYRVTGGKEPEISVISPNPQLDAEYEVKKMNALRNIKGFDKASREKRIAEFMCEGKTRDEAFELLDAEFESKILSVLRYWSHCYAKAKCMVRLTPEEKRHPHEILCDITITDYDVKRHKLLLKGYTKNEAEQMVRDDLDDLTWKD